MRQDLQRIIRDGQNIFLEREGGGGWSNFLGRKSFFLP